MKPLDEKVAPSDAEAARGDRPKRRDDLVVRELDGEALIYDPRTADTHRLNATAWTIWRCCDGRHDLEAIARALTARYEVDEAAARRHAALFLARLAERGLLDEDDNGGAAATSFRGTGDQESVP